MGAGVWEQRNSLELVYTLDSHASVYQVEVAECATVQLTRAVNRGCPIAICSDIRAAVIALNSTSIYSKEVLQCIDTLTALASNNMVTLIWMPGHEGIRRSANQSNLVLGRRSAK